MHEINCIATQLLVLKIGTEFLFFVYDFKKHHNINQRQKTVIIPSDSMLLYI